MSRIKFIEIESLPYKVPPGKLTLKPIFYKNNAKPPNHPKNCTIQPHISGKYTPKIWAIWHSQSMLISSTRALDLRGVTRHRREGVGLVRHMA